MTRILFLSFATAALLLACKEEGPDAPPRKNGCIDTGCAPVTTATPPVDNPDGGVVTPLTGTTGNATLVKGGLGALSGAVWVGGRLLVTDGTQILELGADSNTTSFRAAAGARCLGTDKDGNLLACETTRISRSAATKGAAVTAVAETFETKPFDAPDDVVVREDGNVYFTDSTGASQGTAAVYRVNNGTVTRLAQPPASPNKKFTKPAGIALSRGGDKLFVADGDKVYAARVQENGDVDEFAQNGEIAAGDGMTIDDDGNLYVADSTGVEVLTPLGGKIGTITVPAKPTGVSFGGADRRTLFITASGGIYSIVLNVPGLP